MTPEASASSDLRSLVSVIIPTHRRPNQVREAVLSALAQTWQHVEVIVVADGPDPLTREALLLPNSRLRYLELESNQGPAAARNAGVAASRGEWLAFLDDDDQMCPGKIAAQMELADQSQPTRMVACRVTYRHDGRQEVWPKRPLQSAEDLSEYLLYTLHVLRSLLLVVKIHILGALHVLEKYILFSGQIAMWY